MSDRPIDVVLEGRDYGSVVLGPTPPDMVIDVYSLTPIGPEGPVGPPGPEGPPGQVQEAPVDGMYYGRRNTAWQHVLGLAGGTMNGPIVLTPNQIVDGGII